MQADTHRMRALLRQRGAVNHQDLVGSTPSPVAKCKKRSSVADLPTGPKDAKSTALSVTDEAIIMAFRKHTLLPLGDCLYALQPTIPHLTRSSLHHSFSAMASAACRRWRAINPTSASSNATRSVTSISTSPR